MKLDVNKMYKSLKDEFDNESLSYQSMNQLTKSLNNNLNHEIDMFRVFLYEKREISLVEKNEILMKSIYSIINEYKTNVIHLSQLINLDEK